MNTEKTEVHKNVFAGAETKRKRRGRVHTLLCYHNVLLTIAVQCFSQSDLLQTDKNSVHKSGIDHLCYSNL